MKKKSAKGGSTKEAADQILREIIGGRVRERRSNMGKRLDEVAKALNISGGQLSRYELGQSNMDCVTLLRLAVVLDCAPTAFIEHIRVSS